MTLIVHSAGPGVTVQDLGRPGYLAQGLSQGGAADRLALAEGAALLGQPIGNALEMAGFGGRFQTTIPLRIALSGAPMRATADGAPLAWNASHSLPAGATVDIGGASTGVYGYLTVGGTFDLPQHLGATSAHLAAGLGRVITNGDHLPISAKDGPSGLTLPVENRLEGGILRVLPSLQTDLFPQAERARFEAETFTRDARGNRMGLRVLPQTRGFGLDHGQTILSEVITPGDIQIPGDGAPYVLLAECQTTGGYPRIGTVLPCDLPRVAQAGPGAPLRFLFVTRVEALTAETAYRAHLDRLPRSAVPRVRNPADIPDLLSYTLISGVTAGDMP
ncbi:biotin-dependent carboxyltransferase family protein [Tropicibacter naphthalenivorans]|uniref:KipI antagonist n=1 Tax=Tropicibacter naphthalenivorans TaxID=441103 RepID=A0A0P1GMF2_9RHOB|nr:urea amidolyase [Tropicibacter naphthalenivorans]CUH75827.1 KipI antagonist [Tropicibacter naphthalenivorans]SMC41951.1 allophanate hydrolase [Tropicibacter naphthalenivorans]